MILSELWSWLAAGWLAGWLWFQVDVWMLICHRLHSTSGFKLMFECLFFIGSTRLLSELWSWLAAGWLAGRLNVLIYCLINPYLLFLFISRSLSVFIHFHPTVNIPVFRSLSLFIHCVSFYSHISLWLFLLAIFQNY